MGYSAGTKMETRVTTDTQADQPRAIFHAHTPMSQVIALSFATPLNCSVWRLQHACAGWHLYAPVLGVDVGGGVEQRPAGREVDRRCPGKHRCEWSADNSSGSLRPHVGTMG
jgi:hypothetical protein